MKSDVKVVVSLTHPVPVKARGVLLSESCELRCEFQVRLRGANRRRMLELVR